MFLRQRAKQIIKEKIPFDHMHLMGTFFNPKTRKMKHLLSAQQQRRSEYVKQETLIIDVEEHAGSPPKNKQFLRNTSCTSIQVSASFSTKYFHVQHILSTNCEMITIFCFIINAVGFSNFTFKITNAAYFVFICTINQIFNDMQVCEEKHLCCILGSYSNGLKIVIFI